MTDKIVLYHNKAPLPLCKFLNLAQLAEIINNETLVVWNYKGMEKVIPQSTIFSVYNLLQDYDNQPSRLGKPKNLDLIYWVACHELSNSSNNCYRNTHYRRKRSPDNS